MAEMYFNLVVNKKRTCNTQTQGVKLVPQSYRQEVIDLLNERGYDLDGNLL